MSLVAVFERTKPVLVAALSDMGEEAPFMALGEEHLPNPTAVPAIVWVPVGGSVVPSRQGGADGVTNPRHLWTREEEVLVHLYGGGFAETEDLLNRFVATLRYHLTAWPFRVTSTKWTMGWPVVGSNELQRRFSSGTLCVVTCHFAIPLTTGKMQTARPTTATIAPQTMNPPEGP